MPQRLEWRIDINAPLTTIQTPTLLMQGDNQANVLAVRLTDKGAACDLSGYTVSLWLERRDGVRVPVDGRVEGNLAEVTLPEACYRVNGRYVAFMRITNAVTGEKRTILRLTGVIESEGNGPVLDEEDTIPSLEELLAQITVMEQASAEAYAAAEAARAETDAIAAARTQAQQAVQDAQTAVSVADGWATATATASSLPTDAAPTVALTDTAGGKVIAFGIPKGEKGDRGEKGETGSASSITVNGIEAVNDNITLTASDIGGLDNALSKRDRAYNLLDNSNFCNPVNQRGSTAYSATGYTIDRWRIWQGSSVTVNAGSITVTGNMLQYIVGIPAGRTLTFAYGNGEVTHVGDVGYETANGYYYVNVPAGTWTWAALYEGSYTVDTLPEYVPKGYGAELVECMRYLQVVHTMVSPASSSIGAPSRLFIPLAVEMRITPTVTHTVSDGGAPNSINATTNYIDVTAGNTSFSSLRIVASADL